MQRPVFNFATSGRRYENSPDLNRAANNQGFTTTQYQVQNLGSIASGNFGTSDAGTRSYGAENTAYGGNIPQSQAYRNDLYSNAGFVSPVNTVQQDSYGNHNNGYTYRDMRKEQNTNYGTATSVVQAAKVSTLNIGQSFSTVKTVKTKSAKFIPATDVQTVQQQSFVGQSSYIPVSRHQQFITSQPVRRQIYQQANQVQWVEQQVYRPGYSKLYNNNAEYYRNLAVDDDPTVKKNICSPCCWVLLGLLGLLALVFGILCGLGIFCGDMKSFGFPFINVPGFNGAATNGTTPVIVPVVPSNVTNSTTTPTVIIPTGTGDKNESIQPAPFESDQFTPTQIIAPIILTNTSVTTIDTTTIT